jgi:23S rRNA (pseudouridine1915-N3)-methyltransferase
MQTSNNYNFAAEFCEENHKEAQEPYFCCMKILFLSVGKSNDSYIEEGILDFTGRINKYFTVNWQIITPPKNAASLSEQLLKKAESILIHAQLLQDDYLILLDERGQIFSSPGIAQLIQQRANESSKRVVFLIGGAYGVDETVFKRANTIWSLSKLVFPHMLVRLILSEQIYRACSILRNEKYHHN